MQQQSVNKDYEASRFSSGPTLKNLDLIDLLDNEERILPSDSLKMYNKP